MGPKALKALRELAEPEALRPSQSQPRSKVDRPARGNRRVDRF